MAIEVINIFLLIPVLVLMTEIVFVVIIVVAPDISRNIVGIFIGDHSVVLWVVVEVLFPMVRVDPTHMQLLRPMLLLLLLIPIYGV